MKYAEELYWILDKPGTTTENQDEKIRENIAFVHSLGKKCDSVGWSSLKSDDPRAEEILERIAAFCKENGWTARGTYIREYLELDTQWYEIESTFFKDNTIEEYIDVPTKEGRAARIPYIKAYRELTAAPKGACGSLYVPERFRNAYLDSGLTGLDFCWLKDTGKYTAEQYFAVYGIPLIPRVAVAWDLKKQKLRKLGPDGGWLPRLGEVFHKWTQFDLPYCYRKKDMPSGGIAYAFVPSTFSCCGLYRVLVHKDTVQLLLQKKAIPPSALKPVPVVSKLPRGYTLLRTKKLPRPTTAYMEQSILDYERLKATPRPTWKVSEKDALKVMRSAKTERKSDFEKRLHKAKAEELTGTIFEPMLPYYLVANGGQLSAEFSFLPLDAAQAETEEFYNTLKKEELLENKPEGIVIALCANGDYILCLKSGTVIRFSHEGPEETEQWQSVAQFIVDAIND